MSTDQPVELLRERPSSCPHGGKRPLPARPGEVVQSYEHCTDIECGCGEARADAYIASLPPGTIRPRRADRTVRYHYGSDEQVS